MSYTPQYLPPQQAAQQEQLRQFWQNQMLEIHQVGTDPAEFKNHQLPLARIKKVCSNIVSTFLKQRDGFSRKTNHYRSWQQSILVADHEVGRGRTDDQR